MENLRRKRIKEEVAEEATSTLELLEFTIAGNLFGINVSKVTEIMKYREITPMAASHPCVKGIFMPRDEIVTVIDLPKYMGLPSNDEEERDILMLTNFSSMNAAFHVHTVEAMHQLNWSDVEKPDSTIYGGHDSLVTGNAKIGSRLVTVVDFERILFDINPETGLHFPEISNPARNSHPIVIAEDSAFLLKMLKEALEAAGYTSIKAFSNGQEAWEYLEKIKEGCDDKTLDTAVRAVITDIEMPRMDGHHLTKLIKSDQLLKKLPVLVFSSLIDEAMKIRGESLGVSAHLSKPQIGSLVSTLDRLMSVTP